MKSEHRDPSEYPTLSPPTPPAMGSQRTKRREYRLRRQFVRACLAKNYAKVTSLLRRIKNANLVHRGNNALNLLREPTPGREDEHIAVVRELLRRGCDPNHNEDMAPMHIHLCDVNVQTVPGDAVLRYRDKLVECLRLLLENGADPNHRTPHRSDPPNSIEVDETALSRASDYNTFEEMGLELLDHGIDFRREILLDWERPTGNVLALLNACMSGKIRLLRKMIAKGADPHYWIDKWPWSPLITACANGREEIALFLMDLYEENRVFHVTSRGEDADSLVEIHWGIGDYNLMFRREDVSGPSFVEHAQAMGLTRVVDRAVSLIQKLHRDGIPTSVAGQYSLASDRIINVITGIQQEETNGTIWRVLLVDICQTHDSCFADYRERILFRQKITEHLRQRIHQGLRIVDHVKPPKLLDENGVEQYNYNDDTRERIDRLYHLDSPIEDFELELLACRTDLEFRYHDERTLLMVACEHDRPRLISKLINLGAHAEVVDENGDTTLTLAIFASRPVDTVHYLLDLYESRGSYDYIFHRNRHGHSLVELAHVHHQPGPLHRLRSMYRRALVEVANNPESDLYESWQSPVRSLDVLGIVAEYIV